MGVALISCGVSPYSFQIAILLHHSKSDWFIDRQRSYVLSCWIDWTCFKFGIIVVTFCFFAKEVVFFFSSRVFESKVLDELWGFINSGTQIWAASAVVWWCHESSFSVSSNPVSMFMCYSDVKFMHAIFTPLAKLLFIPGIWHAFVMLNDSKIFYFDTIAGRRELCFDVCRCNNT